MDRQGGAYVYLVGKKEEVDGAEDEYDAKDFVHYGIAEGIDYHNGSCAHDEEGGEDGEQFLPRYVLAVLNYKERGCDHGKEPRQSGGFAIGW